MAKERVPAVPKKSHHSAIRSAWIKSQKESDTEFLSMKTFARMQASGAHEKGEGLEEKCRDWLFNKGSNFSKPPLLLGSTRKKKSGQKTK
jgi:hypothetical protein